MRFHLFARKFFWIGAIASNFDGNFPGRETLKIRVYACMHFVSFVITITRLENSCLSVPCFIITATLMHVLDQNEVLVTH